MIRASRLPLSLLIGVLSLVAVIVFTVGITVEAQDNQQREEGQQQEQEGQQENQQQQNQQQDLEVQQPRQNQDGEQEQQQEPRPEEEAQPERQQQQEQQPEQQQEENQDSGEAYSYVAQPGDSYTLMARKAVQTYGLVNDVNLSQAQIVYAETWLTQQAGQPQLEVGQEVNFQVSQVAQAVRAAQDLTEAEESMWDFYAQQVPSFNTDNVGEGQVQAQTDDRRDEQQEDDDESAKFEGQTKSASNEAGK